MLCKYTYRVIISFNQYRCVYRFYCSVPNSLPELKYLFMRDFLDGVGVLCYVAPVITSRLMINSELSTVIRLQ